MSSDTCARHRPDKPALSLTWLSYLERERQRDLTDVPVVYCCATECRTPVHCGARGRCLQVPLIRVGVDAPDTDRWEDDTFALIYHLMGA